MAMPPREVYILHLTPAAGWRVPGIVRLRRALKMLLRSCGLRCISVEAAAPSIDAEPTEPTDDAAERIPRADT